MAGGSALYFSLPAEPSLFLLLFIPTAALFLYALRHHPYGRPLASVFLVLTLGFGTAQIEARFYGPAMLNQPLPPTGLTGLVYHAEPLPDGGSRLTLLQPVVKGWPEEKAPGFIRVKTALPYEQAPQAGMRVSLWGPLWPAGESTMPEAFDFRRHAYFKGLSANGVNYGELRAQESLSVPSVFDGGLFIPFEKARRFLSLTATQRVAGEAGAMTAALLTGGQSALSAPVMEMMRDSGLSHLLSISGLHVGMIALLVFLPVRFVLSLWPRFALRFSTKKTAACAAMIATMLYTALIGPEAPILRSALMSGGVMLAVLTDRRSQSLRLVALAAMVILLFKPSSLLGPSFQLSFAAVMAMVAAYEKKLDQRLAQGFSFDLPRPVLWASRTLRDMVLTSLLATAATAPFTLYHFQTLNSYGVIANMIAIPLTTLWVMPNLLLTYLTAPFGLAGVFLDAAGWGCEGVIAIAGKVASWPYAEILAPAMPVWAFGFFVAGLLWLCLQSGRGRWLGLLPVCLACVYPLTVEVPSVFISGDGKSWAVQLDDGRLATYGKRNENFILRSWQRHAHSPALVLFNKNNPPEDGLPLSCAGGVCFYEKNGVRVAFLARKAKEEDIRRACTQAVIVMAPLPLSDCPAREVIDAKRLEAGGAHSIVFERGEPKIKAARKARGLRPWSEGWREGAVILDQSQGQSEAFE